MRTSRPKTTATLIVLFLVFAIATSIIALPAVNAHTPAWTIPSWTYLGIVPETIGVNQEMLLVFWVNWYPLTATGAYGDRYTFNIDVTKPDGSKETLGPFTSDPVGGSWATYTPTQVGVYSFVAKFPGKTLTGQPLPPGYTQSTIRNAAYVNDTLSPSESEVEYLTVQQEPVERYQETPLPTGYWTRPIYGANREWYQVAANWLGGAAQQEGPTSNFARGEGPESAHIMWTRPYWSGGIMDTTTGNIGYYSGLSYESFGSPSIILEGKIYYPMSGGNRPSYGWYCVDLYTGETLYYENNTLGTTAMPSYGQVLNYECPNQHGGFPYLWRTSGVGSNTWEMIDGFTGKAICRIGNVSSAGTAFNDKIGSICRINIVGSGANTRLTIWNTTQAIWWRGGYDKFKNNDWSGFTSNDYWLWRTTEQNSLYDGRCGFSLNVSIPAVAGSIRAVRVDEFVIGGTEGFNTGTRSEQGHLWCLSLKPGQQGTLLWNITFTPPVSAQTLTATVDRAKNVTMGTVDPEDGVFFFEQAVTQERWCYSLATGQQLWKCEPESPWNFYGLSDSIYKGKFFSYGYGGELIAYDIKTGKIVWNWSAPDEGLGETWYTHSPLSLGVVADGKLYMYSTEHSPTMPLRRDVHIWCVDAETGELIWKTSCWAQGMKIADGRLVVLNLMDNAIYCFGKGDSATTVSASPEISTHGSSVLIKGTVTDQTASGRLNTNYGLDFSLKGTHAIADEDQEAWMEYLFQQRPIPANAKGVEVSLDALDPNGNFVHIGAVTSDMSGMYSHMFTPEVPGKYTIIATFAGSKSYWPSFAETAIGVDEAPPATAAPEYPQPIDYTMHFVGVAIAMIIAVAIAAVWIKRK